MINHPDCDPNPDHRRRRFRHAATSIVGFDGVFHLSYVLLQPYLPSQYLSTISIKPDETLSSLVTNNKLQSIMLSMYDICM